MKKKFTHLKLAAILGIPRILTMIIVRENSEGVIICPEWATPSWSNSGRIRLRPYWCSRGLQIFIFVVIDTCYAKHLWPWRNMFTKTI
jgi:hypothetical protein